MNWDDARVFLAVLRAGSLSGAARHLACSHSTVRRRLLLFEDAVGARLFVASSAGLVPTDAARDALGAAEALERAALALDRQLSGRSRGLTGRVTVTTLDGLAEWVAPALRAFTRQHPEVRLELRISDRYLDLSRREADVAIRASNRPSETLFGRRVGRFEFAPFAAASLLAAHAGPPEALPFLLYTEDAGARLTERWYAAWSGGRVPTLRVSSGGTLVALVRAGVGGGLLPVDGARDPQLVALGPAVEGLGVDLWCLTHLDLRQSARIRAFMECVAEILADPAPR